MASESTTETSRKALTKVLTAQDDLYNAAIEDGDPVAEAAIDQTYGVYRRQWRDHCLGASKLADQPFPFSCPQARVYCPVLSSTADNDAPAELEHIDLLYDITGTRMRGLAANTQSAIQTAASSYDSAPATVADIVMDEVELISDTDAIMQARGFLNPAELALLRDRNQVITRRIRQLLATLSAARVARNYLVSIS